MDVVRTELFRKLAMHEVRHGNTAKARRNEGDSVARSCQGQCSQGAFDPGGRLRFVTKQQSDRGKLSRIGTWPRVENEPFAVSCLPNFVFQRSMVSIETGRKKSAEDSEAV